MLSLHQEPEDQDASTVVLPRQRFGGVVVEEAERPVVDAAAVPVELAGEQPGPALVFEEDYQLGGPVTLPVPEELRGIVPGPRRSPEAVVLEAFEQHGPDVAVRPVSGGGELGQALASLAGRVGFEPRHAAEEPAEERLSPFVEHALAGTVRCGACGGAWPCGKGDMGAPFVPGEDVVAALDGPPVFREVLEGRPGGSWDENDLTRDLRARLSRLDRALVLVEREVLAAVARCESATRRLGPVRRVERFMELRAELEALFGAAASGELVEQADPSGLTVPCDGRCGDASPHDAHLAEGALERLGGAAAPAGGPVAPGGEGDQVPLVLSGGCVFGRGVDVDGTPVVVVDGVEHGPDGDVTYNEDAVSKPYTARCLCGLEFTTGSHDGAEEDRQVHLDGLLEQTAAAVRGAGVDEEGVSGGEG